MQVAVMTLPVKRQRRADRSLPGVAKLKNTSSAINVQSEAEDILMVDHPGYRFTSSSSSARFTCSAVGGTASGSG